MVRGESVAVIYLSLLVCLFLGQGTEGRGTTHNTTLGTRSTNICTIQTFTHKNSYNDNQYIEKHN